LVFNPCFTPISWWKLFFCLWAFNSVFVAFPFPYVASVG
jgi:hypothetical protein